MKNIITWNVNGIRACHKNGFAKWLKKNRPDIVCLQEIKATASQFPSDILEDNTYQHIIHPAQKAGYSGVAVFTKIKPNKIFLGLGIDKFDEEGRVIILEFDDMVLINGYFPNGQRDHNRVPYKLEFYDAILKRYNEYIKKGFNVVICGDFNTAHHDIDLANPKTNQKTTGFLPEERVWIDHYIKAGMVDCLRELHPDKLGAYTWWTYRGDCRERNIGWRIDYFMTNKTFMSKVKDCKVHPEVLGSDHAPVELILK